MLRIRTHDDFRGILKNYQNPINSGCRFEHPIFKGLRRFWQFSQFYGDYVSQPLERRGHRSILSGKINR